MKRTALALTVVAVAATALVALVSTPASAATFTVTTTADSGPGSLRQAILDANANPGQDLIQFAILGPGPHTIAPATPLPDVNDAVAINGYSQLGSVQNTDPVASNAIIQIVLDGSALPPSSNGLRFAGGSTGSAVQGLAINGFGTGVRVDSNNVRVRGNYIGTDSTGLLADPNTTQGVLLIASNRANVGGPDPAHRNLISSNPTNVRIAGGSNRHVVENNLIGTDATGGAALGGDDGVFIGVGPFDNTIRKNVISGHVENGVTFEGNGGFQDNQVLANLIGTDATGASALPNGLAGVAILSSSGNRIAGNVASGNLGDGILVVDAGDTVVEDNFVGTDGTGANAVPNGANGVLADETSGLIVDENLLSANADDGLEIVASAKARVTRNLVGTAENGTDDLGNVGDGIFLGPGVLDSLVGTTAGGANTVAFNGENGVTVDGGAPASDGVSILGNSIHSNDLLGIDLNDDGVSANDGLGDADGGANETQNFPEITSAQENGTTPVEGDLESEPNTTYRIEVFSSAAADPSGFGEGEEFEGFTTVTTDATGFATWTVVTDEPAGSWMTATATNTADGDSSEFSGAFQVTSPPADLAVTKTDSPDPATIILDTVEYVVTVTNVGGLTATEVTLTDMLPANSTGLLGLLGDVETTQGTCTPPTPWLLNGTVTCALGDIAPGDSVIVTIHVTPLLPGTATNTATATTTAPEPNTANNTATTTTTFVLPP